MAEKGFGVKEVNLIGASGTPTITSPNNLNLNAVNVAISTNVSIGGTLSVTGNISVGGTLTYEDVTNIDSVGLITARTGVKVLSGGLNVVGVSYFNNNIVATATTAISITAADESSDASCNVLFSTAATGNVAPKTGTNLTFNSSNGTLTATTFSGSGASLTSLPAANLTGTLPAISGANLTSLPASTPADTDPQVVFDVSASGSSGYIFTGPGNDGSTVDPDIFLIRGQRYRFINTTGSSHPFEFRNSDNSADFTDGITGSQSGTQDFNVQYDAPSHLKYRCTVHSGMIGNIYIRSGADTGASAGTGNLEVGGFLRFDNTVSKILTDTSDGSDDKAILICGGGDTATSRGALAILYGNELNSGRLDLYSGVGGGAMTFNTGTTTTERIRITSAGKVGIGTDNPGFFTHIQADGVTNDVLKITANGSGQMVNIQNRSNVASIVRFSNYLGNAFWDAQYNTDNSFSLDYGDSQKLSIGSDGLLTATGNADFNVTSGELDIYSTGSGDQLSLRLLNSDASAGNKIGIYFGPANNVAGAYIKGVAESDFSSTANRDAGLEFGTRLNGNFLAPLKISAGGIVTKPSYHPCFRAGRSTDVTPGSQSTIVFNYVANPTHFNQGGHYDNSTGAFTAPVAGIYNFYCQVLWEGLSSGQNMDDAFYVYYNSSGGASGGTLVSYDARRAEYIANETGNAGYYGAHTSIMVAMAAGGSVYIKNNRGSIVVHGNQNFTFFQGYLIG